MAGQIKISEGAPGAGKVLTSNVNGLASWQTPLSSPWQFNGSNIYYTNGRVAIGMNFPRYDLTIYSDNDPHIGFYNSTSGFPVDGLRLVQHPPEVLSGYGTGKTAICILPPIIQTV